VTEGWSRCRRRPSARRSRAPTWTSCSRSRSRASSRCAPRRRRRSPDARSVRTPARPRLLLATHNAHKLRELARLLPGIALDPLPDDLESPPETGDTYAENALIKARAAAAATARSAIADDSGIEAEALGWRPGVRSARYAGERATDADNLAKLAREAPAGSRARYVCVVAHVTPAGEEHLFEGRCAGTIAPAPRGTRGFGYDPLFLPDEAPGRTMAELTDAGKDAISHRGRAARALLAWLVGSARLSAG
jgi:XTP/dITP diphosphohydrolase